LTWITSLHESKKAFKSDVVTLRCVLFAVRALWIALYHADVR
jgi:hypothetical protein